MVFNLLIRTERTTMNNLVPFHSVSQGRIELRHSLIEGNLLNNILPLYHKSGLLGLYAALTVSDLFFIVFVEFYGVF